MIRKLKWVVKNIASGTLRFIIHTQADLKNDLRIYLGSTINLHICQEYLVQLYFSLYFQKIRKWLKWSPPLIFRIIKKEKKNFKFGAKTKTSIIFYLAK